MPWQVQRGSRGIAPFILNLGARLNITPRPLSPPRNNPVTHCTGHAVARLVDALRHKSEGRVFDSRWCHWNFSLTSFRSHYGPGVDSVPNRNEYQWYFLEGNGGRCVGLIYHLHVPIVLKTGSLNVLDPTGPVQACNGIALPLTLPTVQEARCATAPAWAGKENLAVAGFRTPYRPSSRDSLYRLKQ